MLFYSGILLYNLIDMFKIIKIILSFILVLTCITPVFSEETTTLSGGVVIQDSMLLELFGTWRVVSNLEATDSPTNFKTSGVDLWNLSKNDNVIVLCNPLNGATASVRVEYVKDNTIRFTKEGNYDKQILTDTVEITLNGDKFSGRNYLSLKTFSEDNSLKKEKTAIYLLHGDKISGTSILGN